MNFEFEREIGFINSQPSLAECLTSLPAVLETFQTSSIKDSTLIPPPFEQTVLQSLNPCSGSQARPRSQKRASHCLLQPQPPAPAQPGPLAAEFPWMKEKKSSKKTTQAPSSSSPPSSSSVPVPAAGSPAGCESPVLPELSLFPAEPCLQLSQGFSPAAHGSLESPLRFSEEELDFFTSALCTIDLQHFNFQ
ncbi:PREDICTED: homeobox protein Hox-B2-like [Corvus brachyrhynchos]|uniref:homeobox protein Hox-B2-like n=1 Tax=Corvus brachyrhynchos TaxID=85066 RepID=UPI000816707B|nr:PREDICTED: homeobox protein Hox-B2-like [Corvus brachyrhynchos]